MNKKLKIVLLFIVFIFTFIGCENNFNPFIEPESGISAFSILDNRLPFQYVSVQKLYQNPNDKKNLDNLSVTFSVGANDLYYLHDTTFSNKNYLYYYLPDFKIKRGLNYRLTVLYDSAKYVWADAYVYNNPLVSGGLYTSTYLGQIIYGGNLIYSKQGSEYYLFKLFFEYESSEEKSGVKIIETPFSIEIFDQYFVHGKSIDEYEEYQISASYTSTMKRGNPTKGIYDLNNDPNNQNYITYFGNDALLYAFKFLVKNNNPAFITIKRGYFVFYSIDKNIQENFILIGKEQYSVRMDEPLYWSNIKQDKKRGAGFFGALTADTIHVQIPSGLISRFGYKNGQ